MKDIDFDELDRAVSSVLSKNTPVEKSTSVSDEVPASTPLSEGSAPSQPITLEPQSTPEQQTPLTDASTNSTMFETTPSSPETTTAAPSSITLRTRGKFMDVMHPSADMNPSTSSGSRPDFMPPRTLAPLTSRDNAPVEPTAAVDESNALIGAEPAPATDVPEAAVDSQDEPEEMLLLPAETEDDTTETAPAETPGYVDPLDVAAQPNTPLSEETARTETAPQSTPFLSDTKVDKRPLGAFGDADEPDDDLTKNTSDDTQTVPVTPLPRELQPDVVQVESVQEPDQATGTDKPFAASVSVAADTTDDGRVEGHPLFDTSTYHEPIAAAHAKKTAPWVFWVVGLGICLLIGAGVGYFLFTAGF